MKKLVFILCAMVLIVLCANSVSAKAQTQNEPYVILVEFTFDKAKVDEAIDWLSDMQLQTIENEEKCLAYDVLLSQEDSTKVFIYETYENEAAFKLHIKASYYKEIVEKKLQPLIKQQKITKVTPLNFDGTMGDAEI